MHVEVRDSHEASSGIISILLLETGESLTKVPEMLLTPPPSWGSLPGLAFIQVLGVRMGPHDGVVSTSLTEPSPQPLPVLSRFYEWTGSTGLSQPGLSLNEDLQQHFLISHCKSWLRAACWNGWLRTQAIAFDQSS